MYVEVLVSCKGNVFNDAHNHINICIYRDEADSPIPGQRQASLLLE